MKKSMIIMSLLASSALFTPVQAANYGLTEEAVKEIVAQYIKDNPEAILDSVKQHQIAQQERSQQDQRALAREHHDKIYNTSFSPTHGPEDAVVTIVEFYDYNCPACKMMYESLEKVVANNEGKVRVIFKEMPIFGPQSVANAKVAFAVNDVAPEKFFTWHGLMMKNKGRADLAFAVAAVAEAGIDQAKVEKLMREKGDEYERYINEERELAQLLNIRGTPAVIVGDMVVPSAMSVEDLQELVDQFENARDEAIKQATGGVVQNHAD